MNFNSVWSALSNEEVFILALGLGLLIGFIIGFFMFYFFLKNKKRRREKFDFEEETKVRSLKELLDDMEILEFYIYHPGPFLNLKEIDLLRREKKFRLIQIILDQEDDESYLFEVIS